MFRLFWPVSSSDDTGVKLGATSCFTSKLKNNANKTICNAESLSLSKRGCWMESFSCLSERESCQRRSWGGLCLLSLNTAWVFSADLFVEALSRVFEETVQTGSSREGPEVTSVSRRIASFPGVGLRTETLALPHHRLDHRVRSPQQLCHVVLLHQPLQDALPGYHHYTNTQKQSPVHLKEHISVWHPQSC